MCVVRRAQLSLSPFVRHCISGVRVHRGCAHGPAAAISSRKNVKVRTASTQIFTLQDICSKYTVVSLIVLQIEPTRIPRYVFGYWRISPKHSLPCRLGKRRGKASTKPRQPLKSIMYHWMAEEKMRSLILSLNWFYYWKAEVETTSLTTGFNKKITLICLGFVDVACKHTTGRAHIGHQAYREPDNTKSTTKTPHTCARV